MNSYCVWIAHLPCAGRWAIDGYIRSIQSVLAEGVRYRFVDGYGAVHNVTTTQRTGQGGWTINVDGVPDTETYFFKKGHVYVTLYGNATGSEMILADALRFRLVSRSCEAWMLF
jgi:hypothetical protein